VNPDFLSRIEVRWTKVNLCRTQKKKKDIICLLLFICLIFAYYLYLNNCYLCIMFISMFSFSCLFICFDFMFVCFGKNDILFVYLLACLSYYYCYYLGRMKFCKTTLISTHLIKGTILGQALWGANTFLTRN